MNSKNPYRKYESLFEGWPDVHALTERGEHGLRVAGRHFTPENVKRADALCLMVVFLWGALVGWIYYIQYPYLKYGLSSYDVETGAELAILAWVFLSGVTYLLRQYRPPLKETVVFISPNHIFINGRGYDAKVQHKFTMGLHRRAKEEERAEELAEKRAAQRGTRPVWRHLRYYRDSYHIFLEYLGQRILVTDIHNEEHAEKLLRALIAADRIVHKEKTVFATNTNAKMRIGTNTYESDIEESPGARAERQEYFGKRPSLD